MLTSKEIEEFSKQINIRKNDFIILQDTLYQKGYKFKKKNTSSNNCTTLENYLIRKGVQSHVLLGERIENGKEIALKVTNCSEKLYDQMINKINILSKMYKHDDFIVQVYDYFFLEEQQICIQIVELCQRSLKDEIDELNLKEIKFSVDQVMKVFLFAINALCEIHSNDIIHYNIKPSNILLSKNGEYKLADFGISEDDLLLNAQSLSLGQETVFYQSLEQIQYIENVKNNEYENIKIRNSSDIYSMGIILLEILGVVLNVKVSNALLQNDFSEIRKQINFYQYDFYSFVRYFMLQKGEKCRYNAFRLRSQFIYYFENIFPFQVEQNRINKLIKINEINSCNENKKHLAFLYYYLSQTILRNQDSSFIEKSLLIMKQLNLSETLDASLFQEHYSEILINSHKYEESNQQLLLSNKIKTSFLQNDNLDIVQNLLFQSKCLEYLGQYQKMLKKSQISLKILEIIFEKEDSPEIANSLNLIGSAHDKLGDTQQGLVYYQRTFSMRDSLFSGNHPDIADSLLNIGFAHGELNDSQKQFEYIIKAHQMYEELYSGNHPDIAISLNNVGFAYDNINEVSKGLEYFLKALKMYETLYPGNHHEVALIINNIGQAYQYLGDFQKGLQYFLRGLKMYEALFQGDHIDIAESLYNVAKGYDQVGNLQKGLQYYLKANQMFQEQQNEQQFQKTQQCINELKQII